MDTNIRSIEQLDKKTKLELRKSIQKTIATSSKKYELEFETKIRISESKIEVWLENNQLVDVMKYWNCIMELSEEIEEKVVDKGYFYNKWQRREYSLVLIFPKAEQIQTKKKNRELQKFIENKISSVYAEFNQVSTTEVEVDGKEISISFNSEKPYLDKAFWKLLDKVKEAINERLESEGYTYQRTECLYDYVIWHYTYKNEAETGET